MAGGWQEAVRCPQRDPTTLLPSPALGPSQPEPSDGDEEDVAAVRLAFTASFLLRDLPHTWATDTALDMGTGVLCAVQMMGSARQVSRLVPGACLAVPALLLEGLLLRGVVQ